MTSATNFPLSRALPYAVAAILNKSPLRISRCTHYNIQSEQSILGRGDPIYIFPSRFRKSLSLKPTRDMDYKTCTLTASPEGSESKDNSRSNDKNEHLHRLARGVQHACLNDIPSRRAQNYRYANDLGHALLILVGDLLDRCA